MSYRKILTIQDISCVGQCSLTVALPILSAAGMETCILPSAVLSTHTAGFSGYTVRDLTADIPGIAAHWKKENIRFDALYTGYLGSTEQIAYVREIAAELLSDGGAVIVDPAMADNGVLYKGFAPDFPEKMARLCAGADYILPNVTEAALLAGEDPKTAVRTKAEVESLVGRLHELGAKTVVLTGVSLDADSLGTAVSDGSGIVYDFNPRLPRSSHGTGDVFASVFAGAVMRGRTAAEAAALAADIVCAALEATDADHWYGVSFEKVIPDIVRALGRE